MNPAVSQRLSAAVGARLWLVRRRIRSASYLRKWVILGALIGVVGGVGAIVFYSALELATQFCLGFLGGYTPPLPSAKERRR